MPSLYEIATEYRQIADILLDINCDDQTLLDTLEGERWPLEKKSENYAFIIRNLETTVEAIKEAIKNMESRKKSMENRARYLQERLKLAMEIALVNKIECPHFSISIKKNPPSVDIFGEKQIPTQYMNKPLPPAPSPDKKLIKNAIENGIDVPGTRLVQGTRLEIK